MRVIFCLMLLLVIIMFQANILSAKVTNSRADFSGFFRADNPVIDNDNDDIDDYRGTIIGLKVAIQADPEDYENYADLAFVYDYIGDYENELDAFKQVVKYMPEDLDCKDIFYGNLARAYLITGRVNEAKAWLDKADKVNPDNIFNRWHALRYYILTNEHKMAAYELKRLNALTGASRDHCFEAYLFASERANDQELVIELFKEAVNADPKNPLAYRVLGIAIRNSSLENYAKNVPLAIKELKTSLELNPKYTPTYITIADTYMLLGDFTKDEKHHENALSWFNKGYEVDPNNTRLAYATGNFFCYRRDYANAIKKLEFAYLNGLKNKEVASLLAGAYNNKAYEIYQSGKDLKHGLKLVDRALKLEPDDGIALGTKAEILYKMGRYKKAHKYIKQAIELEPGNAEMEQDLVNIEKALKNSTSSGLYAG